MAVVNLQSMSDTYLTHNSIIIIIIIIKHVLIKVTLSFQRHYRGTYYYYCL